VISSNTAATFLFLFFPEFWKGKKEKNRTCDLNIPFPYFYLKKENNVRVIRLNVQTRLRK